MVPILSEDSLYPLQTNVATKEFNNIRNLRATLSSYGMTKLSTASDVTDSNAYSLSAVEKNVSVSGSLANTMNQSDQALQKQFDAIPFNRCDFRGTDTGWYRFAIKRCNCHTTLMKGSIPDIVYINIARTFNFAEPEGHAMLFLTGWDKYVIKPIISRSCVHQLPTIRYVHGEVDAYLDIKYIGDTRGNGISAYMFGGYHNDRSTYYWECIKAEHVEETASNETVVYTYDIPANYGLE